MALSIQNKSLNSVSVFSILYFLKCAFRIISICLLILFITDLLFSVILSYLILFQGCQISYILICMTVNVNFPVYLFMYYVKLLFSHSSECNMGYIFKFFHILQLLSRPFRRVK